MFAELENTEKGVLLPSRRAMLRRSACGFGYLALLGMMDEEIRAEGKSPASKVALGTRGLHFAPRAKRVIFIFLHGGVSHVDSFDPKTELDKHDGKELPFERPLQFGPTGNLFKSPWKFKNYGRSGLPVSELWPNLATRVDDICFIRSMHVEQVDHGGALLQLHTGSAVFPRPSMGAWLLYGLGSENRDLPGFVIVKPMTFHGGIQNYGSAFLPAQYQGTPVGTYSDNMKYATIPHLGRRDTTDTLQRLQLDYVQKANRRGLVGFEEDSRLDARIQAYELAYRMQAAAPEVMDISGESEETLALYGIDQDPTDDFGRQCLLARRLSEQGVRFVQTVHGPNAKWDQHAGLKDGHEGLARQADKPIAGLLQDLKQRGLLDETLVVWGTEFGRTPVSQGGNGRDHNPYGFTLWLAGGGVKGGYSYGATDELGYFAVENKVSMYDFHATILHLLGIDHTRLTYRHNGQDMRLTEVHGHVVDDIIA